MVVSILLVVLMVVGILEPGLLEAYFLQSVVVPLAALGVCLHAFELVVHEGFVNLEDTNAQGTGLEACYIH